MLATQIAVVAALYMMLVAGVLLGQYLSRRPDVPTESPEIIALKARLAEQPTSETIKTNIRNLDRELRRSYFTNRDFVSWGSGLLLLSMIVFVVSAKIALAAKAKLPCPNVVEIPIDRESKEFAAARVGVLVGAAALLIGTLVMVALAERHMAGLQRAVEVAMTQLEDKPDDPGNQTSDNESQQTVPPETSGPAVEASEAWAKAWPRFRGPDGSGHSVYENLPTTWDVTAGKNVVWKTKVPLPGNSSPVIWKNRLFLSGADKDRREVFCFDTTTGKMLWQKEVPSTPASREAISEILEDTGFAAPSPATDGQRVFAMFANGDVGAFDFSGKLLWARSLGIPENIYGHATSLVTCQGRLLIQFDQGGSADDDKSRLLALDVQTGKTLWETKRAVPNSWATPLVVQTKQGWQIITTADPWVIAYDVADGRELWRIECLSGDQGISPVIADGLLQVGNEYCQWQAIRLDLETEPCGKLPEDSILWTGEDGLPDTVSPAVVNGLLLLTTSDGLVTCYDAASGKMLWEEEFEADFTASPGVMGGKVYYIAKEGNGWVLEPTREGCKHLSETDLGEPCVTSPAFQDGRVYLRGRDHIFGFGTRTP